MGSLYDDMMRAHSERVNNGSPRAGWRFFLCNDCGEMWRASTRDFRSPSIDDCSCGNSVPPYAGESDPSLPVDRAGNLIGPSQRILIENVDAD